MPEDTLGPARRLAQDLGNIVRAATAGLGLTSQAGVANERGATRFGVPLGVGVWLPVRDVDLRLDVNDPRVVAEVGLDVDRRGRDGRRGGGLGGGGEAEDGGWRAPPLATTAANPNLFILLPVFFCVRAVARESRFGRCVGQWWWFPFADLLL